MNLPTRQEQVLLLVAKGYCSKEIGRDLGICESTVKNHLRALMARYGARSRTHLVYKAFLEGTI